MLAAAVALGMFIAFMVMAVLSVLAGVDVRPVSARKTELYDWADEPDL